VKKIQIIAAAVIFFSWINGIALAVEVPEKVTLILNKVEVLVDNQKALLDLPPVVDKGTTLVPLRFIGEVFGARVAWDSKMKQVIVVQDLKRVSLWIGKRNADVNGHMLTSSATPRLVDGRTMVPLRFLGEAFGYEIQYENTTKKITILKPNIPPQARFTIDKSFACMGEPLEYTDLSFDPDGDPIVDRIWINNNKSFQIPGVFKISLKVKDSRGVWSDWYEQTVEISPTRNQPPVARFSLEANKVFVDEPVQFFDSSYDPDGDEIVDWQWENRKESYDTPGTYEIGLRVKDRRGAWSERFVQVVEVVEKPNEPPTAKFSVDKTVVDQGETVVFEDASFDSDGDELVEFQWTNKQRAYFQTGTVPVSLRVKDKRGKWSELFTLEINVTEKVLMTELEYNLNNPLPGEIVNLTGTNPLNYKNIVPLAQNSDDSVLLISNCPETVKENGVLYRDMVSGNVRLMYHHKNGSETGKRLYVLAENVGSQESKITVNKKGWGGPSQDDLTIGKNGLARYLVSQINDQIILAPGQIMVLDGNGFGREIPTNNSVFGMMDLNVSGNTMFTFIMVDVGSDPLVGVGYLPVLARDMHQRGTFYGATRTYQLNVAGEDPQRFTLADNKVDSYLGGIDGTTGEQVINKGNYGMVYRVKINTNSRMGLLTNPRGGIFLGAALLPDGTTYGLPGIGLIKQNSQAVMNTVLNNEETEYVFVPPVSSNMPVSLLFIPF